MKIPKVRGNFVDTVRLYLRGGPGGAGHPKFGGIGGQGGNVYLEASKGARLLTLKIADASKRYIAGPGSASEMFSLLGKPGSNVVLHAPLGTVCITDVGALVGELNEDGERVLAARGGDGGSPTNGFIGQNGEQVHVKLVLKTMADVGLLGFPNAGKSTLLKAISGARPKVASYPFTTLRPYLGVLTYPDQRQLSLADLPGLVEGAWKNIGLGHSFLRHIERTKMMAVVVDINGFRLSPKFPHRSALETVLLLNKELELYDPSLLKKPVLLLLNKMDSKGAQEKFDDVVAALQQIEETVKLFPEEMRPKLLFDLHEVVGISAKANTNSVLYVKDRLRLMLDLLDDVPDEATDVTALTTATHKGDLELFEDKVEEHATKLV